MLINIPGCSECFSVFSLYSDYEKLITTKFDDVSCIKYFRVCYMTKIQFRVILGKEIKEARGGEGIPNYDSLFGKVCINYLPKRKQIKASKNSWTSLFEKTNQSRGGDKVRAGAFRTVTSTESLCGRVPGVNFRMMRVRQFP